MSILAGKSGTIFFFLFSFKMVEKSEQTVRNVVALFNQKNKLSSKHYFMDNIPNNRTENKKMKLQMLSRIVTNCKEIIS
jgi:hypothetical protein